MSRPITIDAYFLVMPFLYLEIDVILVFFQGTII